MKGYFEVICRVYKASVRSGKRGPPVAAVISDSQGTKFGRRR